MSNEITMPKLSDTMEEGKIIRWLKHPGDSVHHGDALAEVETDKADMVMESFDDGVLEEIRLRRANRPRSARLSQFCAPRAKRRARPPRLHQPKRRRRARKVSSRRS